ncbi:MAG: (E)-4-hydroxy-3-methylbut-2-enyl-diphosphate synthase [Alistipes sp.]|nr:(E)-4-hydroxy-3-methylbut-2-enyl-diphosphate synthase [Candidatus Alistipes equi]
MNSFKRRLSEEVHIGMHTIGGRNPILVQSMTNTPTADVEASVAQIKRIASVGCPIVRLTAQGEKEGNAFQAIMARLKEEKCDTAIVADIHFVPQIAAIAAQWVDKVRINPGNYRNAHGEFEALIEQCRKRGVAIRIGVNHGSLSKNIVQKLGDTPEGMVESAMEFLRICKKANFDQVVVSMKSSNTRVMVQAYRMLVRSMDKEEMHYPLHIGLTEAGNHLEGRIKSAAAIGALLSDGIGDTIRVSLTEAPENEIPVAKVLVDYFTHRDGEFPTWDTSKYDALKYRPRKGANYPIIHSEIRDGYTVLTAISKNPTLEWRSNIINSDENKQYIIKRTYTDASLYDVAVKAAADMGSILLDGLAAGIWVDAPQLSIEDVEKIELGILQATRSRMTSTEYIACPSCGRTLYNIESTLEKIKERTSHLAGLRIGIMGCIVNGPGEMADADYGYVGAGPGKITLYRGQQIVERGIDQKDAIDHLIELIRQDGRWREK